ncbi:hypothetical protein F4820DRAFT_308555 [Hypoxylon rubiginosum]|uniref:Uncharacterized protein n=1 Tax=Hypoxylon rubiginosum TaxID=110542 RepID=A0ACB9Z0G6_9PEZI|nr:hypothetical protein F4820DRAFT_308555 [Hypoxylon rubiginosum]
MPIVRDGRIRPLAVVIPLILSIAGFILAMIALFAGTGSQQQALEDYHLIAINMSNFGHDLIPTPTSSGSQPTATDGDSSIWDQIEDGLDDLGDDITDELNDIANDVADRLSAELGISQWYSLHVMTACEGNFAPNATSPGAWYNTTNCTAQSPGVHFNLTEVLQREIDEGPLDINAADVPIPDSIQQTIDYVNSFLLAAFVLYVLGSAFSGLSFLSCIVVLTLRRDVIGRGTILINAALSAPAVLALAVGSAIATAVSKRGVAEINDRGAEAGISAVEGTKFMIVSWVAFAVMFVALLFWCVACCLPRRRGSAAAGWGEKAPRASTDSHRGLLGMFRRRR